MGIIIRAKQFIEIHKLMDNVKSLVEEMKIEIEDFYKKLKPLFAKGLPTFGYNNDSLFNKDDYDNLLAQQRVNHDKFQDMEGILKGEYILNKLEDDFDILCQIKNIRKNLPPISFSKCVELEVIAREMQSYTIPSKAHWMEVDNFSKLKLTQGWKKSASQQFILKTRVPDFG